MGVPKFTDYEFRQMINEHEAGASACDIGLKYGISVASFYEHRKRLKGVDISAARRLAEAKMETSKLKRLLHKQIQDNRILREIAKRKW